MMQYETANQLMMPKSLTSVASTEKGTNELPELCAHYGGNRAKEVRMLSSSAWAALYGLTSTVKHFGRLQSSFTVSAEFCILSVG